MRYCLLKPTRSVERSLASLPYPTFVVMAVTNPTFGLIWNRFLLYACCSPCVNLYSPWGCFIPTLMTNIQLSASNFLQVRLTILTCGVICLICDISLKSNRRTKGQNENVWVWKWSYELGEDKLTQPTEMYILCLLYLLPNIFFLTAPHIWLESPQQ